MRVPFLKNCRVPEWSIVAGALLAAVGLSLSLALVRKAGSPELTALVAAMGSERVVEPRLTGGFAYAPVKGPSRAPRPSGDEHSPDVRIALAEIEKLWVRKPSPEAAALLGVARLAVGDVDMAVPLLEEAAGAPDPPSRVRSDLAAAYLARARDRAEAQDLPKALVAADLAVRGEPSLAEAWFNRALALERLHLVNGSRQAWEDYLKVDRDSPWAAEARGRAHYLGAPTSPPIDEQRRQVAAAAASEDAAVIAKTAEMFKQTAREWTEDQLLAAWSEATLSGNPAAARAILAGARRVAEALADLTNDRYLLDGVAATARTAAGRHADDLAHAHIAFRRAMERYENNEFAESGRQFAAIREPLARARTPFALAARLQVTISAYYAADLDSATVELDALLPLATTMHYGRFAGLAHRTRGLLDFVRARFGESLDHYTRALDAFRTSRDAENIAGIEASIAENMEFLGEPKTAWVHRVEALSGFADVRNPRRWHTILVGAALSCLRQGVPQAAAYFQAATLEHAKQWNRPGPLVEAYAREAEVHAQLGAFDLVSKDLAEARRWLAKVPDGPEARQVEARIHLVAASYNSRDIAHADTGALTDALTFLQKGGTKWALAKVYLARGRAYEAMGKPDLAEGDFLAGIREFEQQRASLSAESMRVSYFDQPWDLFSDMVRLQTRIHGRADLALSFAERGRARTLLESVTQSAETQPFDVRSLQHRLADDVAVLYYSVLDDEVIVWRLTKAHLELFRKPLVESELVRRVTRLRAELERRLPASLETASDLYDALVRPAVQDLDAAMTVVIVPDGILHALPFSALVDRTTGRSLVQDRTIAIAPSASVFVEATAADRQRSSSRDRTALIVGNPRVSSTEKLAVPDLPGAAREVDDVAALYVRADTMTAATATKQRFLEQFDRYDVVHFAGHAISNTDYPDLSRLLFASDTSGGAPDSLFGHELARRHFERTQVLVLAACQTSGGRIRRGEGVLSLARPFLAAGVPTVVASLWDADDRATHELLVSFHRALRAGASPARALREAQLVMQTSSDVTLRPPSMWAGFVVIGAVGATESGLSR